MSRADYNWKIAEVEGEATILIVDHDLGNMSVTNDAENVLVEIAAKLLQPITNYRVFYRDSMGLWDELVLDSVGNLERFKAGPRDGKHSDAWAA